MLNNPVDLNLMRYSGKILATLLNQINNWIVPGVTPVSISKRTGEFICSFSGATPAFLGYHGFPAAACISVNEEVVHAIPSERILQEGDVVKFDCGVLLDGHYTDACRTLALGEIPERTRRLIKTTKESLDKGIEAIKPGKQIGDISYNIQRHVERKGFNVHLVYVGHGIGRELHMSPSVPNYGPPAQGELLIEGMCLAIEPVVFDGSTETRVRADRWTAYSPEKISSAHFEDTIIVTNNGVEIITRI